MPTYDYVCRRCDHAFEHFQGMRDKRLRKCPACGEPGLERLIGAGSGIVFKGSGFYETDYKRGGSSGGAKGSGPEDGSKGRSKDDSKGGAGGDAKGGPGGGSADKSTGGSGDGSASGGGRADAGKSSKPGGDSADK